MEEETRKHKQNQDAFVKDKTEVDLQADLEHNRGWLRNFNSKLYDNALTRLIQDSSNGIDVLKTEVGLADKRRSLVKSGVPLVEVAPANDYSFFIPELDTY